MDLGSIGHVWVFCCKGGKGSFGLKGVSDLMVWVQKLGLGFGTFLVGVTVMMSSNTGIADHQDMW